MYKLIDVLGQSIPLTIESNNHMKTNFGAFMSIFLFLVGIGTFLGFGIDIFYKLKPRLNFNRNINDAIPNMTITDRNFLFSIYDQYTDEEIPDFSRRFTVSFDYFNTTDGSFNMIQRIPFEKCS